MTPRLSLTKSLSKQPRLGRVHENTVYTHYIATMFWKQNLETCPWSSPLCCPLESVCALARFSPTVHVLTPGF